jgi:hypothetical protein
MIVKRCEVPPHLPGHGGTQTERTRNLFDLRQDTSCLGASDRTSKRCFQPGEKQLRLEGQQPVHLIAGCAAIGRTITAKDVPSHFAEPLRERRGTQRAQMTHRFVLMVAKPACESIQIDADRAQTHSFLSRHTKKEPLKDVLHQTAFWQRRSHPPNFPTNRELLGVRR